MSHTEFEADLSSQLFGEHENEETIISPKVIFNNEDGSTVKITSRESDLTEE